MFDIIWIRSKFLLHGTMSFDCMLKYTNVKLELLSDNDKLLMLEVKIRGSLMHAIKQYSKTNNH